jgi:hypothetical protein
VKLAILFELISDLNKIEKDCFLVRLLLLRLIGALISAFVYLWKI